MPATGNTYIEACESVRGWAIVPVFLFHINGTLYGYEAVTNPSFFYSFIYAGNTGVTLFFVLSGFLLSLPYFSKTNIDVKKFYTNRALRIIPLYFFMVAVATVFSGDWRSGLKSLFFYDIDFNTLHPFGSVWWSLVVEMQFYAILPILIAIVWYKKRYITGIVILLSAITIYIFLYSFWNELMDLRLRNKLLGFIPGRFPNFLAGIFIAYLFSKYSYVFRSGRKNILFDISLLVLLFIIGLFFQHVSRLGNLAAEIAFPVRHVIEGFIWAAIIFITCVGRSYFTGILVNPLFSSLGVLSYSIYLIHNTVIHFVLSYLNTKNSDFLNGYSVILVISIIIIITIILSALTYHCIEKPFLKLKKSRLLTKPLTNTPDNT